MPDREKVIKGLEEAETMLAKAVYSGGEMTVMGAFKCLNHVSGAIAMLKEQDAVKPTWSRGKPFCGACGLRIHGGKFCSECGKPVLWEGR